LIAIAFDPLRVIDVRARRTAPIPVITKSHAGIIATHNKQTVIGFLDRSLVEIAGDRESARSLIAELDRFGAYVGGHGHAGTAQVAIPMIIDGDKVEKPRFWLIAHDWLLFSHEHNTWLRPNSAS
jgi:hypothetical protein